MGFLHPSWLLFPAFCTLLPPLGASLSLFHDWLAPVPTWTLVLITTSSWFQSFLPIPCRALSKWKPWPLHDVALGLISSSLFLTSMPRSHYPQRAALHVHHGFSHLEPLPQCPFYLGRKSALSAQKKVTLEGLRVNIWGFACHRVSMGATQHGKSHTQYIIKHSGFHQNLILRHEDLEFHIMFTCCKIVFFSWFFPQSFKNVKIALRSWIVWKPGAVWIWLTVCSLTVPWSRLVLALHSHVRWCLQETSLNVGHVWKKKKFFVCAPVGAVHIFSSLPIGSSGQVPYHWDAAPCPKHLAMTCFCAWLPTKAQSPRAELEPACSWAPGPALYSQLGQGLGSEWPLGGAGHSGVVSEPSPLFAWALKGKRLPRWH